MGTFLDLFELFLYANFSRNHSKTLKNRLISGYQKYYFYPRSFTGYVGPILGGSVETFSIISRQIARKVTLFS